MLYQKMKYPLRNRKSPELFREQFPFTDVPRILFNEKIVPVNPAENIWITDTTFRDGQQARAPYTVKQIVHLYDLLHQLGGPCGVIRQSEFFIYSKKDLRALEGCIALNHKYPEITSWIRAKNEDLQLVKSLGLNETGILTSVSDYHIYLKLKSDRKKILEKNLKVVRASLDAGITPRCHFEDITRADIYGFCLPFAEKLLRLSEDSGIPIKIRLCDTMGFGVTYPGTILPRSIPKLVHAFRKEIGYPSELLEWHGHNDFHKVHINASTAWLYGVSALNSSLLGFGERTGNPPLEGAIMEYIALKGQRDGINTNIITKISEFFSNEIKAEIPGNYPFVGENFNATSAGIHADGIQKNQEIYNIFDTEQLLNRPLKIRVNDKSGSTGITRWINDNIEAIKDGRVEAIDSNDPGIKHIYNWVIDQYDQGRTTSISSEELISLANEHIPSLSELF